MVECAGIGARPSYLGTFASLCLAMLRVGVVARVNRNRAYEQQLCRLAQPMG